MVNVLCKHFKATVLKMLKEQKEYMEKVKKIMYAQNGNIYKEKPENKKILINVATEMTFLH